jgi:hypothetical protein
MLKTMNHLGLILGEKYPLKSEHPFEVISVDETLLVTTT